MKSLDHHYAKVAYNRINAIPLDSKQAKEYGSLCHSFPSMVLLNGLRLTIAFLNKEESSTNQQYIKDIEEAIGFTNLKQGIPEHSTEYRYLAQSALKAAVWFKRYAEAILKVKGSQENDADGAG